jgi:hypothetical protein
MAYSTPTNISLSFPTNADLSNNQFQFVVLDQAGAVGPCDATHKPLGVLSNVPSSGALGQYAATVDLVGVTRIAVKGVYAAGSILCPGVDGTNVGVGMTAADASVVGGPSFNYARAMTLEASTKAYDIVSALLLGPQAGIDSSSVA